MTQAASMWPQQYRRLAIVAPCVPEASGGARVVENYVPMFRSLGLEVEVVSVYPGTRKAAFVPKVIVRRRDLHRGPLFRGGASRGRRLWMLPVVAFKRLDWALAMRRYRALMSSFGSDTVVLFTHVAPLALLRDAGFSWPQDRPLLIGQHHSPFISIEEDPVLAQRLVTEFSQVDCFVALSDEDAARFAEILRVPCHSIPNPAAICGPFRPLSGDAPGTRPRRAVALARLSGEKQLDFMIRAFAKATEDERLAEWCLDIYGAGPERGALEVVIDEVGGRDRIRLRGTVDDVDPVLRSASLLLLTSRYEGLPMSILEAAAQEVPVLAVSCSPRLADLVTELCGTLVQPSGNEDAYAESLRALLLDEAGIRRAGELARVASWRYSPEVISSEWAKVVDSASITDTR